MTQGEPAEKTVAATAVLLIAVTELVRAKSATPVLIDAYDDACDLLVKSLRENGNQDAPLQTLSKALARLRLAIETTR